MGVSTADFFWRGHTQNCNDNIHSNIENANNWSKSCRWYVKSNFQSVIEFEFMARAKGSFKSANTIITTGVNPPRTPDSGKCVYLRHLLMWANTNYFDWQSQHPISFVFFQSRPLYPTLEKETIFMPFTTIMSPYPHSYVRHVKSTKVLPIIIN